MDKININELDFEELEKYIESLGEKKFHAKQIYKWLHRIGVTSFDEMTDISKSLRQKLSDNTYILNMEVIQCQTSKKDGTKKFLIKLNDNAAIESVLMKYNYGNTICVSTQVGCKMGCKFCASTKEGFERSLLASEIEGELLTIERYTKEKISKGDLCINDKVIYSSNYMVKNGDVISLKRSGRIVLKEYIKTTKTGNILVKIGRFS